MNDVMVYIYYRLVVLKKRIVANILESLQQAVLDMLSANGYDQNGDPLVSP